MPDRFDLIAEIGITHGGKLDVAKRLADSAAEAGFAAVKGQHFRPETLTHDPRDRAILAPLALSVDDHARLFEHCAGLGVEYLVTPFDLQAVDDLEAIGVLRYKVASTDITWRPLLERIAATHKPVLLSTGGASFGEIAQALGWLNDRRGPLIVVCPVTLLHCVSAYPVPLVDSRMARIVWLSESFNRCVGYSDHARNLDAIVAALLLGARTVEVHVCPDGYTGPDAEVSYPVGMFGSVVSAVRYTVEGDASSPAACESFARQYLRRGPDGLRPVRP